MHDPTLHNSDTGIDGDGDSEPRRFFFDIEKLPPDFPTHKHASQF
jgi:hypothetical protein